MFKTVSPESVGISSKKVLDFIKRLDGMGFATHSIIMARGNGIFAEGYYAPYTEKTKQRMYSVSKSFVSVAIGLLEEEGKLSLDDKFLRYFPEYEVDQNKKHFLDMTLRDALTMRSCMDGYTQWRGMKTRCDSYFVTEPNKMPGTVFKYDSAASFMLGVIVEKLTGKSFFEYLKEKILLDIGFSADSYCLTVSGNHGFGDSGVMCTARELLSFARFVMNGGVWNGKRLMNEDYLRTATSKLVDNSENSNLLDYNCHGYGYQIWKAPRDGFAFVGMGNQLAICDPKTDFIFVITSDNQGAESARHLLFHMLYTEIVEQLGTPIEENQAEYMQLREYLKNAKLIFEKGDKESPLCDKISGKTFFSDKNPMGIEYFRFDFKDGENKFTYRNAQGEKELLFGMCENVFSKFPQFDFPDTLVPEKIPGHKFDCAASAAFKTENKLDMKVQIIDKHLGNMLFSFCFSDDGKASCVRMKKNAVCFLDEYSGIMNAYVKE